MNTLDDVFNFVFAHDKTIVYGNLGRKPLILSDYITKNYPTFDVQVFSKYYYFPSSQRIKTNEKEIGKCDLLIYLEPPKQMSMLTLDRVARIVVFTSHLNFNGDSCEYISYYQTPDIHKEMLNNKRLLNMQECSVEASKGDLLKTQYDYFNIKTIGVNHPLCDINIGKNTLALDSKSFLIVDLTNTTSSLHLLVSLWDVMDYLKDNLDMIEKWIICFPEKRMRQYHAFVQECRNKLMCKQFKYGNVTSKARLFSLTPFYQSMIVDIDSPCIVKKFCNLKYITPANENDAYTCSLKHQLTPLAGHVYLI